MRADRLISMLMILQTRGNVTARELAGELEVSERTVYRDVIALSTSGVPVYTERGPGGGIRLIEAYRSNLTGLTREQVRALFMISIPEPLVQLGYGHELRAAMLKLAASLPSTLRSDDKITRQRILIDPEPWDRDQRSVPVPFLQIVQQAVWEGYVLRVRYRLMAGPRIDSIEVILHPYGLVAKAGKWYLVARQEDQMRVLPVESIADAQILDGPFDFPLDFKLEAFWKQWCLGQKAYHTAFAVRLRVHPDLLSKLPACVGGQTGLDVFSQDAQDETGWTTCELRFGSHEEAREKLLQFGGAIEVIEPIALRYSLKDYAEQILAVYSDRA
jgi:predicted DNA-binding transcriptional regulator YafY